MPKPITASLVSNLRPKANPYEVRDSKFPGFFVRVERSGTKTYYVQYSRKMRKRIGRADAIAPDDARKQARDIVARVECGLPVDEPKPEDNRITLREFVETVYHEYVHANLSLPDQTVSRLHLNFEHLYDMPMEDVAKRDIESWRLNKKKNNRKASTINRALADLKSVYSRAKELGYININPISDVKKSRELPHEERYLSEEEEFRLLKALEQRDKARLNQVSTLSDMPPVYVETKVGGVWLFPSDHLTPAIILSLHTGLRRGELTKLKWNDVKREEAGQYLVVRAANAKSRKRRFIPLSQTASMILENWRKHPKRGNVYLFEQRDGRPFEGFKSCFEKVLAAAQIFGFRWHDLRHSFASKLVSRGHDLYRVQELLGHSSPKLTMRYAHLSRDDLFKFVSLLDYSSQDRTGDDRPSI